MSCSLFLADLLHFYPLSTEVLSFVICQILGFPSDDNVLRMQPSNCCTFSYNVCWTSRPKSGETSFLFTILVSDWPSVVYCCCHPAGSWTLFNSRVFENGNRWCNSSLDGIRSL